MGSERGALADAATKLVIGDRSGTAWTRARQSLYSFIRYKPLGAASAVLIVIMVLAAIFAPLITRYGETEQVEGIVAISGDIVMTIADGQERVLRTLKPDENGGLLTIQLRQENPGAQVRLREHRTMLRPLSPEEALNPKQIISTYRELHPDAWQVRSVPFRLVGPGKQFWFGSDQLGRDILTRVVYGARISLQVGILATLMACAIGMAFGIISGYYMGWFDMIFQRFVDGLIAFPTLILALVLSGVLGGGLWNLILLLGIVLSPNVIRVVRGNVLSLKENQYVEAARAVGASEIRVMFWHIMPNVWTPVLVLAGLLIGGVILIEASLSFLGFGVPPPIPSWGSMLSRAGRDFFEVAWWMAVFPGAALSLAVLGWNLLGDALRDVMDPRLKGTTRAS